MTTQPQILSSTSKAVGRFKESKDFLSKISWIFFVKNQFIGVLVFGFALLSPNMFYCSVSALLGSILFAAFSKLNESAFTPASLYNPYLTGMAVGAFYKFSLTVFLLCLAAGIMTLLVNILFEKKLSYYNLPVLSLPFALVSAGVSATLSYYSGLFSLEFYGLSLPEFSFLPLFLSSFFESVGSIIFMPNNICGMLLFFILAAVSRVIVIHALFGFFTGLMFKAALTGNFLQSCNSFESFNWTLTGIAFGAFTCRAGAKSFVLSAVGVAICVFSGSVLIAAGSSFNAVVYTLPFNLTVLLMFASLKSGGAACFPAVIQNTPELSMAEELNSEQRFKYKEPSILLPFFGVCKVYQGFNGPWTHNAKWQHAVDFIKVDENAKMFSGSGEVLQEYYSYGIPVLAPVSGWVVSCRHDIHDNIPGKVNSAENWGNFVILKTADGVFVELSHIKQFSLLVKTGDYVIAGQMVGECGNSGFSAFPHLHVQVQKSGWLGEETAPFNFAVTKTGEEVFYNTIPKEGELVSSPVFHQNADNFLFGPLNSKWFIKDLDSGQNYEISVCRTQDIYGTCYLEDESSNRLFFNNTGGSYRAVSYTGSTGSPLRQLFLAAPSIPFLTDESFYWNETVPLNIYYASPKAQMKAFMASIFGGVKLPEGRWKKDGLLVKGEVNECQTCLTLSEDMQLESFSVNGKKYLKRRYSL